MSQNKHDLQVATLARCINRCANAADGRGRRHPVRHCAQALQAQGTSPAMAQACADAARAVGEAIALAAA